MPILLSLVPSVVAILAALFTKQVIPSLLAGLWTGAFISSPGFLSSISKTVSLITGVVSNTGNLDVLLFLYVFSGFIAMVQIAGGVQGFVKIMDRWVTGKRSALLATWLLEPLTFIDCGFRVVAAGSIIKPLAQKYGISGERLAYNLNNSASPVIALIPFATTYVGYMLGVLNSGMKAANIDGSAFTLFLHTIPFNFFSWASIGVSLVAIITERQFRAMAATEAKVQDLESQETILEGGRHVATSHGQAKLRPHLAHEMAEEIDSTVEDVDAHQLDTNKDQMGVAAGKSIMTGEEHAEHQMTSLEHNHDMDMPPELPPRAINLLLPIALLIVLSFFMVWWDGRTKADSLIQIFAQANASRAMFLALFITTIGTGLFYRLQGLRLKSLTEQFIQGGNKLMVTIVILLLAWPISTISGELGLSRLITSTLGTALPSLAVPIVAFIFTGAVTYFIGSSWGAWALMMPLAIPLAATSGASVPLVAAAVFSGGTFGDVTSPLSGMAAMSSGIAEVEHMSYVRAMTPYNLTAAILAILLFLFAPMIIPS